MSLCLGGRGGGGDGGVAVVDGPLWCSGDVDSGRYAGCLVGVKTIDAVVRSGDASWQKYWEHT